MKNNPHDRHLSQADIDYLAGGEPVWPEADRRFYELHRPYVLPDRQFERIREERSEGLVAFMVGLAAGLAFAAVLFVAAF